MKKIFLPIILLFLSFIAFAQADSLPPIQNDSTSVEWISKRYESFKHYLQSTVKYPRKLLIQETFINGKVRFSYTINANWSISNITIISSPHELCSKEVINSIKQMPKYWKPATINGKNTSSIYQGEILFEITP